MVPSPNSLSRLKRSIVFLQECWPLVSGGLVIVGLVLAADREGRQHAELLALRDEVRVLRQLVEERLPAPPYRRLDTQQDGRIMFAKLA